MGKESIPFGDYIKARREELGISMRALATEIGISPAYLSDIENGNRRAPAKYLQSFIEALKLTSQDQIHKFNDLAGVSQRGEHADINTYIDDKPYARVAMRTAIDKGLTDEDWQRLVERIKKGKF